MCNAYGICYITCAFNACDGLECIGSGCNVTYLLSSESIATAESVVEYDAFTLLTSVEDGCQAIGLETFDDFEENMDGSAIFSSSSNICCGGIHVI